MVFEQTLHLRQIISTMAMYNYQITSYQLSKKKQYTFCSGKSWENFIKHFPGLKNKIQGLSRTIQDNKKNPGLFQDVATLLVVIIKEYVSTSTQGFTKTIVFVGVKMSDFLLTTKQIKKK